MICHSLRKYCASNSQADLADIAFRTRSLLANQKESTKPAHTRFKNANAEQCGKQSWHKKWQCSKHWIHHVLFDHLIACQSLHQSWPLAPQHLGLRELTLRLCYQYSHCSARSHARYAMAPHALQRSTCCYPEMRRTTKHLYAKAT